MMFKWKRDFTCRALKWTFSRVTGHMTHQSWVQHLSLVLVWTVTFPLKNAATSHVEFILPYLCWVWMKLRKIIHGVWYHYHEICTYLVNTRNYPSLTIQFFVKVLLHSLVQEASVRIGIKGSWRLWFRKCVLYFHRMLHITYQVLVKLRYSGIWPLNSAQLLMSRPLFF